MQKYYVINFSAKFIRIEELSKQELEKKLNDGDWGDHPWPVDTIQANDGCGHVIIKGEIVKPQALRVITSYKVP